MQPPEYLLETIVTRLKLKKQRPAVPGVEKISDRRLAGRYDAHIPRLFNPGILRDINNMSSTSGRPAGFAKMVTKCAFDTFHESQPQYHRYPPGHQ